VEILSDVDNVVSVSYIKCVPNDVSVILEYTF
jgi:hypothetical protein